METTTMGYMGGCQKYCPFLGTLNIRCRIIIGIQKGTIILTTTQKDPKSTPTYAHDALGEASAQLPALLVRRLLFTESLFIAHLEDPKFTNNTPTLGYFFT